ncbi:hypothetical protein CHS0354_005655 [Potamilus streckersoni]|uniref:RING-type domain-containing protein n=1 Tax=Potamilus streckersoni TaxID=2493646 RepID=A0AAE0S0I7_9BIVA|nr:hypothetical protein CHS0354_005655 [Potamilus streckersoni]
MPKRKQSFVIDDDERYFLNPESVSCHLYCSICQEVFIDPQRAPCGHSYCRKCIIPWLKTNKTCPEDRKPLQVHQLHHDFILENIIGDQMVACPFRKSGCEFIGQLQQLSTHKKNCDFNPANLPDFLKDTQESPVLTECSSPSSLDSIPSPGQPSLKMRLFRKGSSQKELLKSMFSGKENSS